MLTAIEIAAGVKTGKLDAQKITADCLANIEKRDGEIGAFLSIQKTLAMAAAENAKNNGGVLAGVPIAIKDNICWQDVPTTCASKMLENFRPPYSATAIEILQKNGAVLLGKTNLDEFAMGSSTENSALKVTRNPIDLSRTTGGSSGGSAAAVAAGFCPLALGSDTGGSIRQPASYCGVVGFKPTYGAISRYGLIAFGSSLDQIGIFANNVADTNFLFNVLSIPDHRDATCHQQPFKKLEKLPDNLSGITIGLPEEYFAVDGLQLSVKNAILSTIENLKNAGAKIKNISLPSLKYAVPTYYVIATAEASSNLARYDGVHYTARTNAENIIDLFSQTRAQFFGEEVKRRIMLGTYVLSAGYYDAYYLRALKMRTLIAQEFTRIFNEVDIIASPVAPTTAFKLGEKISDPLSMYLSDIYTISANLAGIPGISVPCGRDENNLPIGIQFMGERFGDSKVLTTAHVCESCN